MNRLLNKIQCALFGHCMVIVNSKGYVRCHVCGKPRKKRYYWK